MKIRTATIRDTKKLSNLIHFEVYVHRHLEWRQPFDWIGQNLFLILETNGEIVAALVCPPEPPSVSWIRLVTIASSQEVVPIWEILWEEALTLLKDNGEVRWVAAMPLHGWMQSLLIKSGFQNNYNVLMLSWEKRGIPQDIIGLPGHIRPLQQDDLPFVRKIDELAFEPVWQNSIDVLALAYKLSAVSTVIEINHEIVGYQISTTSPAGGHLARLAIHPDFQGVGLGYNLLQDLIIRFTQRGARRVTVNTQKDNIPSLALYAKAGFNPTGEEYPYYQLSL